MKTGKLNYIIKEKLITQQHCSKLFWINKEVVTPKLKRIGNGLANNNFFGFAL